MNNKDQKLEQLQKAILLKRLQKKAKSQAVNQQDSDKITCVDRSQKLPLSFAQQRLWFLQQLDDKASSAYNMPAALALRGVLNREALSHALNTLLARHESLRTRFVEHDGIPEQVISPVDALFDLTETDLSASPTAQAELTQRQQAQAHTPFDLSSDTLVRAELVRLKENEHTLLITFHHIITDGWSISLFVEELSALYQTFNQGKPSPLTPLSIQYVDYANWEQGWLQGDVLEKHTKFWQDYLTDVPSLLTLPLDKPRPAKPSYQGKDVRFTLSHQLQRSLITLSQRHGTTLFMTLLSAWGHLLGRISGQDEVVIGTPVANRQHPDLEPLIGLFVNTLPVRIQCAHTDDVQQALSHIKQQTLSAFEHQALQFDQIVELSAPTRSLSYNPLVQVMFSLDQMAQDQVLSLDGLSVTRLPGSDDAAQFDLSLVLQESEQGLVGQLRYATDLFEHDSMTRLVGYFERMLMAIVEDDRQVLSQISLLSLAEQEVVVKQFNDNYTELPEGLLIHQRFEQYAQATPDAIALRFKGQSMSYRTLNEQANQLAHHLLSMGLKPEQCVAVSTDRSLEHIVSLLAILKAGGAYLPIDASYPVERVNYILDDAKPIALLTTRALKEKCGDTSLPVMFMDNQFDGLCASYSTENIDTQTTGLTERHLANVIYTSGSTGLPKGVMVEHRNVIQLVVNEPSVAISAQDNVVYCANPAFDASTWEIWLALLNGAKLVITPQESLLNAQDFGALLRDEQASIVQLTVGLFNQYAQALATEFSQLNYLLFGGDQASVSVVKSVYEHSRPRHLVHTYGPTESVAFTTTFEVNDEVLTAQHLPIGRGIANSQIYILDEHLAPCPVGSVGEIYVGGAGVTRGYLNREELTQERFITDPFSEDKEARLYKTGDLGRWNREGQVDFLGRNDFQVKIRGFRVELGEIEHYLVACNGVDKAVVLAQGEGGDKRLVAYVIGKDKEHALDVSVIRSQLNEQLAQYMIPSAIVVMEAFPLTANGKLDRRALPVPSDDDLSTCVYVHPEGEVEEAIAHIWQALLNVEQVGRYDDFFALGGHSLLAVQMVSRVKQELQIEVQLQDLFNHSSCAEFARVIEGANDNHSAAMAVVDRTQPIELSYAQQRLWFIEQLDQNAGGAYNMPSALRMKGDLDVTALKLALDHIVQRHENLRTSFVETNGTAYQIINDEETNFDLIECDLSSEEFVEDKLKIISDEEVRKPFNLATGPLSRGQLIKLAEQEYVLLLTQHHIISDAWSSSLLIEEITHLYRDFSAGNSPSLPVLTHQYADYAHWQKQFLSGEQLATDVEYWRDHLADIPELINLPTDRPRPVKQSYKGDALNVELPTLLTKSLREFCQQQGLTPYMAMMAAWSIVLSRLSGQSDVVIGTPVANRNRREAENIVGFFVNTLAIKVSVDEERKINELLRQIKQSTLNAYEHQELPFEQVVDAIQPNRSMSHSPLTQVILSINNTPGTDNLSLPGVEVSDYQLTDLTTQFDLCLSLTDNEQTIDGSLRYSTDLFDQSTMLRLLDSLFTVLEQIVTSENLSINEVSSLSQEQTNQLTHVFNEVVESYPKDQTISQCFETQVTATPDDVALDFDGEKITYGELNQQANQIAHYLIKQGVVANDRVVICLERSIDLVVAMLAVLKAGAAYVPLDPSYPEDRINFMLSDSKAKVVITDSELEQLLPMIDVPALRMDVERTLIAKVMPKSNIDASDDIDCVNNLAYVIYTSGSTGQPKGVLVEQLNVVRLVKNPDFVTLSGQSVIAQASNASFDAATFEIWGALLNGGRLVHVSKETLLSPDDLKFHIESNQINTLFVTTALLNRVAQDEPTCFSSLDYLFFGGEQVSPQAVERIVSLGKPDHLVHVYGPTENTTFSTWHEVDETTVARYNTVPIGGSLAATRLYVLDSHRNLLPIGAPGELYLGGDGVARGYLNQTELTEEVFVEDPFIGKPDARMYKTGDLVRWTADGNIVFLDRNDTQVKIRGFRIELGEVESAINQCSGVSDSIALAHSDEQGSKRLVAYVVADGSKGLSNNDIKQELNEHLPDYMVPVLIIELESLPLTANGKVDKKALPTPDFGGLSENTYVAPTNEIEEVLCAVWADVLGLERVGIHDNVFDIGGDSIRSIAIIAKAKERGLDFAVVDIFENPTVASLAAILLTKDKREEQAVEIELVSEQDRLLMPADVEDLYPVTMLQLGMIYHNELNKGEGVYHDVFSHQLDLPRWDQALMQTVLNEMARKHPVLRTSFDLSTFSEPMQLVHKDANVPMTVIDLRTTSDIEQQQIIQEFVNEEWRTNITLTQAPLLKVYIHQLTDNSIQYTVSFHHAILDGWSMASFETELFSTYLACVENQESAESVISLGDARLTPKLAVMKERIALASEAHQEFWQHYLADHSFSALPTHDGSSEAELTHVVERVKGAYLTKTQSEKLQALAGELGVPLRTVLLCAHMHVVSLISGKQDVVSGLVSNIRAEEEGGDKVLGLFLNTLPFRQALSRGSWSDLIKETYQSELKLMKHRHYPYFELHNQNNNQPLYEITFNFTNFHIYNKLATSMSGVSNTMAFESTGHGLDINFNFSESKGVHVEVTPGKLSQHQGELILGYYMRVLDAIASAPEQDNLSINLLAEEEASYQLDTLAHGDIIENSNLLAHQLFEQQVLETPEKIAVRFNDQTLTFDALNKQANQLARYLLAHGVTSESKVALVLNRGLNPIIAMLATLKAGACYVPIDPSYPQERIDYMLADTAPDIILSETALNSKFSLGQQSICCLDDRAIVSELSAFDPSNLVMSEANVGADHLAYIIYTSGSTGLPKGVMVEHGNLRNLVASHIDMTSLSSTDNVLQFASYSFDVAVGEIYPALAVGATLVIRPSNIVSPDDSFEQIIEHHQITVCDLPTAFWHQWTQRLISQNSKLQSSMRLVIVGGDKAELNQVAQWQKICGQCQWINGYGPTEATVTATSKTISAKQQLPDIVSIGKPLNNVTTYVFDDQMRLLPIGVTGELYIGGLGIARGYLNQEEMTQARFVTHPLSPEQRLYKTGDLARWNAAGELEFMGRNDFQVKIRGFRVELGEVENQLLNLQMVNQAFVTTFEPTDGQKQIAAYLVCNEQDAQATEIKSLLTTVLADYMIPSAFVLLDTLPTTPNGKIDKSALPAPEITVSASQYEAPQGQQETAIADIWKKLLGIEQIGRQDNFFELGGHSLMIVRLIDAMRQAEMAIDVSTVFAAPTIAQMAQVIVEQSNHGETFNVPENLLVNQPSQITPELLPLIDLTQDQIDAIVDQVDGGVANIQDIYGLGSAQQGILFHHLLSPEQDAYLLRTALAFDSKAKRDQFIHSLQLIVDRHDILRTTIFSQELEQAVQVVKRNVTLPIFELIFDKSDTHDEFLKATDPNQLTMALSEPHLLRVYTAYDEASDEWLFALIHHHIICDHVTIEIMMEELIAIEQDAYHQLPEPVPYRNFIAQLQADDRASHQAFFEQMLSDIDEPTAPFGILETRGTQSGFSSAELELDGQLSQQVREIAKAMEITPAVIFHLVMSLVVAKTSGKDDVVFGSVMSGRLQGNQSNARVLGMFINTLPVRINLAQSNISALVKATQERLTELLAHEQMPLAQAQKCSRVDSAMPLFTALFNFRHSHEEEGKQANEAIDHWQGIRTIANDEKTNYPITVNVDDFGQGFGISSQCLGSISATKVTQYFEQALISLIDALKCGLNVSPMTLNILPASERAALVTQTRDFITTNKLPALVDEAFEHIAQQMPSQIALSYQAQTLTYQELDEKANQLAHILVEEGVSSNSRVGLCFDRHPDMIIAILAVLKAGGGYVPLDPNYPLDRLQFVVDDCQPTLIISHLEFETLTSSLSSSVIAMDEIGARLVEMPVSKPILVEPRSDSDLAYVIYTSGSTGLPKGVEIEHCNVVRLFSSTQQWYDFNPHDVWTLFHSYAFDFTVWEIWGALFYGGKLVVVPFDITRSPTDFYQLVCEENVTVLNQTPSAFKQFIQAQKTIESDQSHQLRYVIFGGEALDTASLAPWVAQQTNQKTRLINMYGITETTVHVTYHEVTISDIENSGVSPIGHPIPDLQLYVLDEFLEPVPYNVAGELYVGGAGVARGYINRPELNQERFIECPFGEQDGKLYKTGDLAKRQIDGSIAYLGRNDFQVKIRGFRIELGEIEAKLSQCAGIEDSAVVVRTDRDGQKYLAAYFVAPDSLTVQQIKQQLANALTDYMVPQSFVRMPALPLTNNGKLDQKALPEPDISAVAASDYVAPQTVIEQQLCQIWQDVLSLSKVGVNDNFFDIGGDSIKSISIVGIAKSQGIEIAIVDLFKHPTVGALSQFIESQQQSSAINKEIVLIAPEDQAMLPDDVEDAYPLSMLQMGMVFHNELALEQGVYHDVFSNNAKLPVWSPQALKQALALMSAKHPILRTGFDLKHYSQPLQLVYRTAEVPFVEIDLRTQSSEQQTQIIAEFVDKERLTQFDLLEAPLLRVFIHRLGADEIQFTISFHHAILDGWSMASLQTELFNLYADLIEENAQTPTVTALSITPKAAIEKEQLALTNQESKAFWQRYLTDYQYCELPQGQGQATEHLSVKGALSVDLKEKLSEHATLLGVPLRTILLAGHMRAIAVFTGKSDITSGLVCNVRPETQQGDKVLGLFLNTLPIRQQVTQVSWRDFIEQTYQHELAVLENRHYPYFQLHLDNNRQAYFDIVFNYTNFHVYDDVKMNASEGGYKEVFESTGYGLGVNFSHNTQGGIDIELNPQTLSQAQTDVLLGYYLEILTDIATGLEQCMTDKSYLSMSMHKQVTQDFNHTERAFPVYCAIHQLFEQQVSLYRDLIAVEYQEQSLTYLQLNERANQLARYLRSQDIGSGSVVGICLERSIEMVVAVLAVFKSGAAYVPLDPNYPEQRLQYIIDDVTPQLVITNELCRSVVASSSAVSVVIDDEILQRQLMSLPSDNIDIEEINLATNDHAYIIYTSGSTGQPKGVINRHSSLVNLIQAQIEQYHVVDSSRVLQFVSFSFDVCISEVFMALCSGATLVVAKPEQLLPGDPLMETLTEQSISHISLPSAVLATLPQNVPTPDLQTVIVGGDILPVGLANHWSTRCRLINAYGPSESAVCVTNYEHKVTDDTVVPIGKPLANTQIFILNEHMQPVPIGTPGEIYIGGAGLGVGYLNQKALSAEKFVDNPLSNFEGNKLYRTGDLGYWREDGNVVFAGRIDFQVKIRGFRIELGEIEHQLSQHEGIKDVAVIATGESAEDKFLVAYYTPLPNIDVDEAALKHWLTLQLSDYMIPSVFVALEALPLTNNGKLDRKALPAPQRKNLSDNYVAPTNETEAQLCEIWQRYLHVDKVGIHDAFFDMGGNSLMIVKLHAELKALYATPLVIADYFQYTTVSQLAAYINAGPSSKSKRVTTSASRADKRRKRMANTRKSRVERQK